MKSLAVRVLGDFGVDGVEPQALGSRKARLALQLLAMAEGQAVPSDVLIDALWDDDSRVRLKAAWALGRIGDPRAEAPLRRLYRIEDEWAQEIIKEALAGIRDFAQER